MTTSSKLDNQKLGGYISAGRFDVSSSSNDKDLFGQKDDVRSEESSYRLEISIVDATDDYQEVEICYGDKKKRKKITKFLPKNLASNFFTSDYLKIESHIKQIAQRQAPSPSVRVGATNISNLAVTKKGAEQFPLQEKLLRALSKINQMQKDGAAYEKIWDGEARINIDSNFVNLAPQEKLELRNQESQRRVGDLTTTEKAMLVAIINRLRPEEQKINRTVVSSKFSEIVDKKSFKGFIDEVIGLTADKTKLFTALFYNAQQDQISDGKKSGIAGYLNNILDEQDDSKRKHQIKFLEQIMKDIIEVQKNLKSVY